jgi:beta-lactamase class A
VLPAHALPPPAIEQPASREVSFGVVAGEAAAGTRRVVVSARGRVLASRPLGRRRFLLHVQLPIGDVSVRVTTIAKDGRRSSRLVTGVYGLPAAGSPRRSNEREDSGLAAELRGLTRQFHGTTAFYVQSLTTGRGAGWNAKARFPAASTLKLAIAAAVLAAQSGLPAPGSYVGLLLHSMLVYSDNASANALETWLGGSTIGGSHQIDALMRSIGMSDSIMYGGYEAGTYARSIPSHVDSQPEFGIGKYTTAADLATLLRSIWLAAGSRGPLHSARPSFTPDDARYLLWLLAQVRDTAKLDGIVRRTRGVAVLHKAGWVSSARHDAGLVFWRGGVFVASVMTWNPAGDGISADRLAARCAANALARFDRRG